MKKRIAYITGSRADFGRAKYILKLLEESADFHLDVIVTGMHLTVEFGNTIRDIEKQFFVADKVDALLSGDSLSSMAKSFGITVMGISQTFERIKPEMVLVLGDRGEMLAGAIAANHQNIPISHIGGGFKSGSIDDKIRDAITIFSDYHFVPNELALKRVLSLGARTDASFVVGAPDLEIIRKKEYTPAEEVIKKYCINRGKPLILVSYHPVTNEYSKNIENMRIVCDALVEINIPCIITYPNADAGGRQMIEVLKEYKNSKNFSVFPHIPYNDYLGLMSIANIMCGNSSAGIIESPSFSLATINIGSRQKDRQRAINVIDVNENTNEILKALKIALYDVKFKENLNHCMNPYGVGTTSELIYSEIKEIFKKNDY